MPDYGFSLTRNFPCLRFCPYTRKKRLGKTVYSGIFYAVLRRTQNCTAKQFDGFYMNMAFIVNDLIYPHEPSNMMQTIKTINF